MILSFLKNKKVPILFFLVLFISIPDVAEGIASSFFQICSPGEWLRFPMQTFQCALAWYFTMGVKMVSILLFMVFAIPLLIVGAFFSIIASLLSNSLFPLLSIPVLGSPIVVEMWRFVRDFSNMFFILFFVLIGLATILNVAKYKYQKALPLLIIIVLLINFSLFFVGLIVDMGNILTSVFIDSVQGGIAEFHNTLNPFQRNVVTNGIMDIWQEPWTAPFNSLTIAIGNIAYAFSLTGVYLIVILTFLIIWFIFAFRIAILWMLAILSPLAFLSYVFDSTRSFIWNKWLSNLIKWSFVAVPILFFMFIAVNILNSAPAELEQIVSAIPPDQLTGGRITTLLTAFLTPLIALIIMFLGVILSMTILPEGAQAAIESGKKTGATVLNVAKSGAKRSSTYNKAESSIMKKMESVGLMKTGSHSQKIQGEKKNAGKAIEEMNTKDLTNALGKWNITAPEIAAIMEKLADKGALSHQLYNKHINKAEIGGVDKDILLASNPMLAETKGDGKKATSMATKSVEKLSKIHHDNWTMSTTDPDKQKNQLEMAVSLIENPKKAKEFSRLIDEDKRKAVEGYLKNKGNRKKMRTEMKKRKINNPGKKIVSATMHLEP